MRLANGGVWAGEDLAVDAGQLCPQCGAMMVEIDRLTTEDGAVFTRYACAREDCTGQWMSKKVLRMRSLG
jgi:hypothetical protein